MRILLLLLLTFPTYSTELQWIEREIEALETSLSNYIEKVQFTNDKNTITDLECNIMMNQPATKKVLFDGAKSVNVPTFEFFEYVNPWKTNMPAISKEEKINIARADLNKARVFLFFLPLYQKLYSHANSKIPEEKRYAQFLLASEKRMLQLAQRSLAGLKPSDLTSAIQQYDFMRNELSTIEFPTKYSFYRQRIRVSIDPEEAARQEISRLMSSIHRLSKDV